MTDPRRDVVFGEFGAVYVPGSGGVLPADYDPEYGVPKAWVAVWRAELDEQNRYPLRLLAGWLARLWRRVTGG